MRALTAILVAAATLLVAGASPASAKPKLTGEVKVAIGPKGWELLVPARYPLDASGREVEGQTTIKVPGKSKWTWSWPDRPHAGTLRLADGRNSFHYVHGIHLPKGKARAILAAGPKARATVSLTSGSELTATRGTVRKSQVGVGRAGPGFCATADLVEVIRADQSYKDIPLPACGRKLVWQIVDAPDKGNYVRYTNRVRYIAGPGRFGADEFILEGRFNRRLVASQRVQIRVTNTRASNKSVIAFGDSVTAGFGYFGATGKPMTIGQLYGCKPGATVLNDACSSNSYNRNSSVGTKPNYLPDYGLSRNISWPAQWANQYGITNFKNLAVTGSAPTDWLPGGQFYSTLEQIQSQNPDYILMTLGANPLLSDVLFNVDVMGCALESDLFGDFRQCVLDAFATVDLGPRMNQVFTELVQNTTSQIVLMQYPLSIPSSAIAYSATQLEQMESLLNEVIASEASQVSTSRINAVSPPRFNVGIDMEPMYPSNFSCSFLGYKVDGPSVQSTPTQDELEVDHPLSFCSGPSIGQPWVISGDTGIHPSAAGYFQMASQIPAPGS